MSGDRGLKFQNPFPDSGSGSGGLVLTNAGRLAMAEGDETIRQSLMMLLATTPGERVMRPDYGCALNRLMFAPNDATTAGLAIHYVRQAIVRWEPRVEILRLDAGPGDEAQQLVISLQYRARLTGGIASVEVAMDLQGDGT